MVDAINQFHEESLDGSFPSPEFPFNKEAVLDKLYY